jgi:hypothetical protein
MIAGLMLWSCPGANNISVAGFRGESDFRGDHHQNSTDENFEGSCAIRSYGYLLIQGLIFAELGKSWHRTLCLSDCF